LIAELRLQTEIVEEEKKKKKKKKKKTDMMKVAVTE